MVPYRVPLSQIQWFKGACMYDDNDGEDQQPESGRRKRDKSKRTLAKRGADKVKAPVKTPKRSKIAKMQGRGSSARIVTSNRRAAKKNKLAAKRKAREAKKTDK